MCVSVSLGCGSRDASDARAVVSHPLGDVVVLDLTPSHASRVSRVIALFLGDSGTTSTILVGSGVERPDDRVVSDEDLLRKLRLLRTRVESEDVTPRVVNMSFGRPARSTDATHALDSNGDETTRRIAAQIDALRARGVDVVASAGNGERPLFPGTLGNVLSVGALDMNLARTRREVVAAVATPPSDIRMPCGPFRIGGGWVGGASSYGTAVLAGWLFASANGRAPLPVERVRFRWNEETACWCIVSGSETVLGCHRVIEDLLSSAATSNR